MTIDSSFVCVLLLVSSCLANDVGNFASPEEGSGEMDYGHLCQTAATNATALNQLCRECIKNETLRALITECRQQVYGAPDLASSAIKLCAANDVTRIDLETRYISCLASKKTNAEMIGHEWSSNCGFCKHKESLAKTDTCLSDDIVKTSWIECRNTVYGTRDPKQVADVYCALHSSERKAKDEQLFKCISDKNISKDKWNLAFKNCHH